MRVLVSALLLVAVSAGCRGGNPGMGSVGRTVPPPATGSFGAPDAYYNRRPAGTPATPGAPRSGTSLGFDDGAVDTLDGGWRSAGNNQLPVLGERSTPASFDAPVGAGVANSNSNFSAAGNGYSSSEANSSLAGRGMRVNDGTGFAEPQRFTAAAAREIGKSLSPPVIDFSASPGVNEASSESVNNTGGGSLSFRPPSIRRSNVETPTGTTYLR